MMERNELIRKAAGGLRAMAELLESELGALPGIEAGAKAQPAACAVPEEKPATMDEARKVLALRAKEGMGAQVRMLLQLHGAQKLSEIDPGKFSILARQGEKLETLEVIAGTLEKQKANGFEDVFPELFRHHYATCLADLDPNYYESFLSDAEELNHAR